jgi:transposase
VVGLTFGGQVNVRRTRYVGQAKTHLQYVMTAAMINVMRILHWFAEVPKAKTSYSSFAQWYQRATS